MRRRRRTRSKQLLLFLSLPPRLVENSLWDWRQCLLKPDKRWLYLSFLNRPRVTPRSSHSLIKTRRTRRRKTLIDLTHQIYIIHPCRRCFRIMMAFTQRGGGGFGQGVMLWFSLLKNETCRPHQVFLRLDDHVVVRFLHCWPVSNMFPLPWFTFSRIEARGKTK